MDIIELMNNPLTQAGSASPFIRLVLAQAAFFGMPPQAVATLDDLAAMLGFYDPLSKGQNGHLASPLVKWRTDSRQPSFERITELERLAYMQRAMIAFGGAPPGHMVGTAEIVCAMANTYRDGTPDAHMKVFEWAASYAMSYVYDATREQICKDHHWSLIADDDVLKPTGRYHIAYTEMATSIRRHAIAASQAESFAHPRQVMRPLAAHFVRMTRRHIALARNHEDPDVARLLVPELEERLVRIEAMFPDLEPLIAELEAEAHETTAAAVKAADAA